MNLQDFLSNRIHQEGVMPLDVFQRWALSHYYTTQAVLGVRGDFITAPEVSQMFGEMVGLWWIDLWQQLGSPPSFQLLELGPGRGTLMADMLRVATRVAPAFVKAAHIFCVEISPLLQKEQQARLADIPVVYTSTLEDALSQGQSLGPLFGVANEFFDALPIKQFEKKEGVWYERCVGWDPENQAFFMTHGPAANITAKGDDGSIYEMSPERERLFQDLTQHVKQREGALWICDYGYKTSKALGDSLQGIYHQQKSSPLAHVGETDLSSHVNFGIFQEIAAAQGLKDKGPRNQGAFLKALGIIQRLAQLKEGKSPQEKARLQSEVERLTHNLQMGHLFQVYAVYAPHHLTPCGF